MKVAVHLILNYSVLLLSNQPGCDNYRILGPTEPSQAEATAPTGARASAATSTIVKPCPGTYDGGAAAETTETATPPANSSMQVNFFIIKPS